MDRLAAAAGAVIAIRADVESDQQYASSSGTSIKFDPRQFRFPAIVVNCQRLRHERAPCTFAKILARKSCSRFSTRARFKPARLGSALSYQNRARAWTRSFVAGSCDSANSHQPSASFN